MTDNTPYWIRCLAHAYIALQVHVLVWCISSTISLQAGDRETLTSHLKDIHDIEGFSPIHSDSITAWIADIHSPIKPNDTFDVTVKIHEGSEIEDRSVSYKHLATFTMPCASQCQQQTILQSVSCYTDKPVKSIFVNDRRWKDTTLLACTGLTKPPTIRVDCLL